jgi:short-subunit dehydrogenase
VNNAGVGATQPLVDSDVESLDRMIQLNVTALTASRMPWRQPSWRVAQGAIINIASIVAVAPELLNGTYGGTKAFVLALSQSLHHELGSKGVQVQPCCRAPRAPTSGTSPACRSATCPPRS